MDAQRELRIVNSERDFVCFAALQSANRPIAAGDRYVRADPEHQPWATTTGKARIGSADDARQSGANFAIGRSAAAEFDSEHEIVSDLDIRREAQDQS